MPPAAGATPFATIGDIASLGTTAMTMLARKFEQFEGDDPVARFFATITTMDNSIIIERTINGVGVAPLVIPGKTDQITDNPQVDRMRVNPAYSRESDFIPSNIVNNLRAVGTINEREGRDFVAQRIQRLTSRSNALWSLLRAQALLGGINYVDARTGASINAPSNIPNSNLLDVEAAGGVGWAGALAKPVTNLIYFRRKIFNIAKVEPTSIIMSGDLLTILEQNAEVLARTEQAFNPVGAAQFQDGKLVRIGGMTIYTYDQIVQDPASPHGVAKIWPINKVVITTARHPRFASETLGKMMFCVGEDPAGRPGTWMRVGPDQMPPAAPGRTMQMGSSGLPFLVYPEWVGILTVDSVNDLIALVPNAVTNLF